MPTPLEILLDPISLTVLALFAGVMLWEAAAPARKLPRIPGWHVRSLLSFGVYFYLASYLPLLWDGWFAQYQLFDLTGLGVVGGTIVGLLVYEVGAWVYHRAMHGLEPLWRIHQMHHSAERLDTFGALYFHPLDMVGWTAVSSATLVLAIGIVPQAATNIVLFLMFLAVFQHANVKTPRWLGYVIQRPESHTVHHGRGVHFKNFADLPIIDILFGSFENPEGYEHETGFYTGASARVGEMLLLRDVTRPKDDIEVSPPSSSAMAHG